MNSSLNMDTLFLRDYIQKNKFTDSSLVDLFPSIERNKKFRNEFSPTLVDSKLLIEKEKLR